jgi:enoyl-CoA hydratase/carnithine racemase
MLAETGIWCLVSKEPWSLRTNGQVASVLLVARVLLSSEEPQLRMAASKFARAGRPLMLKGAGRSIFPGPWPAVSRLRCSRPWPVVESKRFAVETRRYASTFQKHQKNASILCDAENLPSGQGKVATVTVSNPRKLNIVNTPLFLQLLDTFETLAKDDSLRAVVLTGAKTQTKAQAFIGGADITEMFAIETPDQARSFITKIHDVCTAMRKLPVPVIARVDGFCLGAGLEIMAACDLRVATKESVFGMPEVKVGLASVVEARLLCDLIGWGRARRLVYLAENIDATTAERWGLVEEVVEDTAQLDQTVDEWLRMLADSGPLAIRAQKELCRKWEQSSVDKGIEAGIECFAKSFEDGGREQKILMGAFVNRKR